MTKITLNLDELKAFLMKANMPHASGGAKPIQEEDGSRTIKFTDGNYRMHDNFFGGEPYGGRLVIFFNDKPVFMEVYYGKTSKPVDEVYAFLREALQHPDQTNPFRGPAEYGKDNLVYKNTTTGDISSHTVHEYIYEDDVEIYSAVFIGGLVDQNAPGAM